MNDVDCAKSLVLDDIVVSLVHGNGFCVAQNTMELVGDVESMSSLLA